MTATSTGAILRRGALPDETVINSEIVALEESGTPTFHPLQHPGSAKSAIFYYVFDVLILSGRNVMSEPLSERRAFLSRHVLANLDEPIRHSPELKASLSDLVKSVGAQGLEGLVAKRLDSPYEPGQCSGAWQKMRLNQAQEFVISGYTPGGKTFDALIFGNYSGAELVYAGRTRSAFTPAAREQLYRHFRGLETPDCPFVNLPEAKTGRWGEGLTVEKMKECRWPKPQLVGQFEFVEWTPDGHLRHSRFIS